MRPCPGAVTEAKWGLSNLTPDVIAGNEQAGICAVIASGGQLTREQVHTVAEFWADPKPGHDGWVLASAMMGGHALRDQIDTPKPQAGINLVLGGTLAALTGVSKICLVELEPHLPEVTKFVISQTVEDLQVGPVQAHAVKQDDGFFWAGYGIEQLRETLITRLGLEHTPPPWRYQTKTIRASVEGEASEIEIDFGEVQQRSTLTIHAAATDKNALESYLNSELKKLGELENQFISYLQGAIATAHRSALDRLGRRITIELQNDALKELSPAEVAAHQHADEKLLKKINAKKIIRQSVEDAAAMITLEAEAHAEMIARRVEQIFGVEFLDIVELDYKQAEKVLAETIVEEVLYRSTKPTANQERATLEPVLIAPTSAIVQWSKTVNAEVSDELDQGTIGLFHNKYGQHLIDEAAEAWQGVDIETGTLPEQVEAAAGGRRKKTKTRAKKWHHTPSKKGASKFLTEPAAPFGYKRVKQFLWQPGSPKSGQHHPEHTDHHYATTEDPDGYERQPHDHASNCYCKWTLSNIRFEKTSSLI